MSLDILTKKGQEHAIHEYRAVELWNNQYPDIDYVITPRKEPAVIDAILVKNGEIIGAVEQKSRNASLEQLVKWNYEWLVTYKKIEECVTVSTALGVSFFGFLYLIESDMLLVKKISDSNGKFTVDITTAFTKTQANINGGKIVRENAYINMREATIINNKA